MQIPEQPFSPFRFSHLRKISDFMRTACFQRTHDIPAQLFIHLFKIRTHSLHIIVFHTALQKINDFWIDSKISRRFGRFDLTDQYARISLLYHLIRIKSKAANQAAAEDAASFYATGKETSLFRVVSWLTAYFAP